MRRWLLSLGFLAWMGSASALHTEEEQEPILANISRVSVSTWQDRTYHYRMAVDDDIETSWGTGREFYPKKEWIILYLEEPMYVSKISVATGLQTPSPNGPLGNFVVNGRPKDVSVYFSDGTKQDVRFNDDIGFQDRYLRPLRTRWVKLVINDIYYASPDGGNAQKFDDFGIAEIKVFGTPTPILEPIED